MKNPLPRIRMLDGFNEGWLEVEHGKVGWLKGNVTLETVLNALINPDVHWAFQVTTVIKLARTKIIRRASSALHHLRARCD